MNIKNRPALPPKSKILPLRRVREKGRIILAKLPIYEKNRIRFIDFTDIVYCKANSNYTQIHLKSGECILTSKSLKIIVSKINSNHFFRTHASYLVNLSFMTELVKNDAWTVNVLGTNIPVSRARIGNLKNYLNL